MKWKLKNKRKERSNGYMASLMKASEKEGVSIEQRMLNRPCVNSNYLLGLNHLALDCITKDTIMVEIGCHRGVSTELFAQHCKKIYAVDPWELVDASYGESKFSTSQSAARAECLSRLKHYNNVEIINDFSENASKLFDNESIDMVYIDGEHTAEAVKIDLRSWMPKVKRGGIISGHDGNRESVSQPLRDAGFEGCLKSLYLDTSWKFTK